MEKIISVTEIGEYVNHNSCDRRFKLHYNKMQLARKLPFHDQFFNPMDPVLKKLGHQREDEWALSLKKAGYPEKTHPPLTVSEEYIDWALLLPQILGSSEEKFFYRELKINGKLGTFQIKGRIDFFIVQTFEGKKHIRIVESKSSRKDKTYQKIQAVVYKMLLDNILFELGLSESITINTTLVRIDQKSNQLQDMLESEPIETKLYEKDIWNLINDNGKFDHILATSLEDIPYKIDANCESCTLRSHCLPEAARCNGLQLLGLDPSIIKAFENIGVHTLTDLGDIDLNGDMAKQIIENQNFTQNLKYLKIKAKIRSKNIPCRDSDEHIWDLEKLPHKTYGGRLPAYEIDGKRLVRIYMTVHYDYTEDRIGAITAHVTDSPKKLKTKFDSNYKPISGIVEIDENDDTSEVRGVDIIEIKPSKWEGDNFYKDSQAENHILTSFFDKVANAIATISYDESVKLHFYVWSKYEMMHLIEACVRSGDTLLARLNHLLGCRESLEQLIFSSLEDEVYDRYATAWTGRALAVAASLSWFGDRFHWRRTIRNQNVDLDNAFTQDIFDFKTQLAVDDNCQWAKKRDQGMKRRIEIRPRFHDSLTAAYWRAYWGELKANDEDDASTVKSIDRYNNAKELLYLDTYLTARTHALRWIEEKIEKNRDIVKPDLLINEIKNFQLNVHSAAQASIDFLRLDFHVKNAEWISDHIMPPEQRLSNAKTLPLADITYMHNNIYSGRIDHESFGISLESLKNNFTLDEGSYARLIPYSEKDKSQSLYELKNASATVVIKEINWDSKIVTIELRPMYSQSRYIYQSREISFERGTLNPSISEYVYGRIENRLTFFPQMSAYDWFNQSNPKIPEIDSMIELDQSEYQEYKNILSQIEINGYKFREDQIEAIIDGLSSKVQLLQGPPGTGKTEVTAFATLLRIYHLSKKLNKNLQIIIVASTHMAVDTLLNRIKNRVSIFNENLAIAGLVPLKIDLFKIVTSSGSNSAMIPEIQAASSYQKMERSLKEANNILGGTPSAIIKLAEEWSKKTKYKDKAFGFQTPLMIIDEASMMLYPIFLSLATLVENEGTIMLTGDHLQLAPIVAHDWENESRPPVVTYKPYSSAFQALVDMKKNYLLSDKALLRKGLTYTFRLPKEVYELIKGIYKKEDIVLQGREYNSKEDIELSDDVFYNINQFEEGLFVILHDEAESRRSNDTEVKIIKQLLEKNVTKPETTVILTPYSAQRSTLKKELLPIYQNLEIETIEKLQGGEQDTVIFSTAVSDSYAIASNVDHILNLNRSNVGFSRSKKKLIVICSIEVLNYIPPNHENYSAASLWKGLRELCQYNLGNYIVNDNHNAQVYMFKP